MRPIRLVSGLVLGAGLAAGVGCASFTDPAVRLARCIQRTASADLERADCDLGVPGGYLVVLHPRGELPARRLIAAGVPAHQLPTLRQLRLTPASAIYVIPDAASPRPSRTTSQVRYVEIPDLLVAKVAPGRSLTLRLGRTAAGLSVIDLR